MPVDWLFLAPSAVTLVWALRIFFLKNLDKVQLFVICSMVTALLNYFNIGGPGLALFILPLLHFAVRQKVAPHGITKWDVLVLVPSVVLSPFSGTLIFKAFFCLQIASLTVWSFISIDKYNRRLAEFYDSSSPLSAENIQQVLIFSLSAILVTLLGILLPAGLMSVFWIRLTYVLFTAILQFMVGYYAYMMKDAPSISAEVLDTRDSPDVLNESDDDLIRRAIEDELYLDPSISLVSMSEKLGTNRTYLSQSIHSCRGQNFSDFINSLRINRFIETISAKDSDMSIKEAALKSGYNNLQSFYRNFSEIYKMTPKDWMSKHGINPRYQ